MLTDSDIPVGLSISPAAAGGGGGGISQARLLMHFDGNLNDSSSNPKTISIHSGAINYGAGKFDQAATFNGATVLSVLSDPELKFQTGNFTAECFFKTNSTDIGTLLSQGNNGFTLFSYNGGIYYQVYTYGEGLVQGAFNLPSSIADNQWHHIALVKNLGVGKIYVDGISRATFNLSDLYYLNDSTKLGIGGYINESNNTIDLLFNGSIDDVRISAESIYVNDFTVSESPLT